MTDTAETKAEDRAFFDANIRTPEMEMAEIGADVPSANEHHLNLTGSIISIDYPLTNVNVMTNCRAKSQLGQHVNSVLIERAYRIKNNCDI